MRFSHVGLITRGLMVDRDDWRRLAACAGRLDLDWFDQSAADGRLCKVVCSGCWVRARCLRDALERRDPWGIWGGLGPRERAKIARRLGYSKPAMMPVHGT